jgi:error-prone DNA polymerase
LEESHANSGRSDLRGTTGDIVSQSSPPPSDSDPAGVASKEAATLRVFCRGHPLAAIRGRLARHGVVMSRDLRRLCSGSSVKVSGLRVIVHTPPTKSGKRVMFVTLEDEGGLMDVVVFPKAQILNAGLILTSEVITLEGTLQRQGKDGVSISIILRRIIPSLTGALRDILRQGPPPAPVRKERQGLMF